MNNNEAFTLRRTTRRLEAQYALAVSEQLSALDAASRFIREIAADPEHGRFSSEGNLVTAAADVARWTTELRVLTVALEALRDE